MSHKSKDNEFHFSVQMLFRWFIFAAAIFLIYTYVSNGQAHILGDSTITLQEQLNLQPAIDNLISRLPPPSQSALKNLNNLPIVTSVQDKINHINQNLNGFPDKQFKQLLRFLIVTFSDSLLKSVDQK
ncbi:MAG: hypothetical protein NTY75_03875 [Candidatus Shapirobacteria bacterium]|nr:hypothetical protein [Candidatus Shapirobacteria bacterium]